MNYLFIGCSPRSGSTVLTQLLNTDPRIVVGMERFKHVKGKLTPELFLEERFFDMRPEDTNVQYPKVYEAARSKFESSNLLYVGDKVPMYYRRFHELSRNFPGAKLIFLYRDVYDVASSFNVRANNENDSWPETNDYEVAVEIWNDSLSKALKFIRRNENQNIFVLKYEAFFCGDLRYLDALYAFLNLEVTDNVRSKFTSYCRDWDQRKSKKLLLDEKMRKHISSKMDRKSLFWIEKHLPQFEERYEFLVVGKSKTIRRSQSLLAGSCGTSIEMKPFLQRLKTENSWDDIGINGKKLRYIAYINSLHLIKELKDLKQVIEAGLEIACEYLLIITPIPEYNENGSETILDETMINRLMKETVGERFFSSKRYWKDSKSGREKGEIIVIARLSDEVPDIEIEI